MRVLVTGNEGYIGSVLVPLLHDRGHDVHGLDTGWFRECAVDTVSSVPTTRLDVRDVQPEHLTGIDAIIHLAGLSNDPMGDVDAALTHSINAAGTAQLVYAARTAGVRRFVFASTCSVYGPGAGDALLSEEGRVAPLTSYAHSKLAAEEIVLCAQSPAFSTTVMRGSTIYGYSPRIRLDLVVNELVATAVTTGEIRLRSTGNAWRPFLHVEDFARALAAFLEATQSLAGPGRVNIGSADGNHRVIDVARLVSAATGTEISFDPSADTDHRNYRVSFERLARELPDFQCEWTMERGIRDLAERLRRAAHEGRLASLDRYYRVTHLRESILHGGRAD
jgi:nucleoside-diphosphate-sugar epimerase